MDAFPSFELAFLVCKETDQKVGENKSRPHLLTRFEGDPSSRFWRSRSLRRRRPIAVDTVFDVDA